MLVEGRAASPAREGKSLSEGWGGQLSVERKGKGCMSHEAPGWGHLALKGVKKARKGGCDVGIYGWKGRRLRAYEKNHFLWGSGRASHRGFPTWGSRPWLPSQGKVVFAMGSLHTAWL